VAGVGYDPAGQIPGEPAVISAVHRLAYAAARASTGHLRKVDGRWVPAGDPTEVALETRPPWRLDRDRNPLLLGAIAVELGMLAVFVGVPPVTRLLGGGWPTPLGWALAALAIPAVLVADAVAKRHARPSTKQRPLLRVVPDQAA